MNRRDHRGSGGAAHRYRAAAALVVTVVVALATVATFAIGRNYRSLDDPTSGMPDRPVFISAPDAVLRAEGGLDPNSTDEAPGLPREDIRTITVTPEEIVLLEGGVPVRTIAATEPVTTPSRLTDLVADPTWMRRTGETEVTLSAALVMRPDTTLVVGAPLTRLVLDTQPGVFVGGAEARLAFTDVTVEAADADVPQDGEVGAGSRPYVIAQGGVMTVTDSVFRHLGRDWTGSYGVSWTKGAGGYAVDSTFEDGYMGIFAATAIDVRFEGNTLRGNTLFGINAHQISAGVTIADNLVEDNGRTGIMLSDHVTGGVVRDNVSRGNGVDGIMLVDGSAGGTVTGNLVAHNAGDGIAVAASSDVTVAGNTIVDNRVAVDVYDGSAGTVLHGNVIDDNGLAVQGVDPIGNTILSNGDHWRPWVLVAIWVLAVAAVYGGIWGSRRIRLRTDQALARTQWARLLEPETPTMEAAQ